MDFNYDEKLKITDVFVTKQDKCFNCKQFENCILIKALQHHVVYPSSEKITISFCDVEKNTK